MPAAMYKTAAIVRRSRPLARDAWLRWKSRNFWKNKCERGRSRPCGRSLKFIVEVMHARRTNNLSARKRDSSGQAQWQRLQGVPRDGRYLGPPEGMSHLRSRRLLRLIQEQARHQALSPDETSDHAVFRARERTGVGAMWMKSF